MPPVSLLLTAQYLPSGEKAIQLGIDAPQIHQVQQAGAIFRNHDYWPTRSQTV